MSQTPSGQPGDKAGNSLEEQSALLEQLFNNAPLPIQRCSIEGQILRANQASEEVFGYTCEEMRGRFVDDLFAAPDTYDEAVKNTRDVLEGKTVFFEGKRRRKNGEAIYVKGTAFPIVLKGVQIGTYSIYTDQTAVKAAEIRLSQSEERYRSLVDDIPAMICAFDDRGILSFVNREFCTFFSLPAENLLGTSLLRFIPPEHHPAIVSHLISLSETKPVITTEIPTLPPGSAPRWHRWTVRLVSERENGRRLFRAAGQDITDSRLVQTTLAENLAAMERTFSEAIEVLASATDAKDPYTAEHQRRVARLSAAMAEQLGYDSAFIRGVEQAAMVHDIGKIEIPGEILSKPGRLSPLEFELIKGHSRAGAKILEKIHLPWPLHTIVAQHHERLDGSGYPDGLSGRQILPEARIIAVADIVEAMSSYRPYRPALGIGAALDEILRLRAEALDEDCVDCCVSLFLKKGYSLDG